MLKFSGYFRTLQISDLHNTSTFSCSHATGTCHSHPWGGDGSLAPYRSQAPMSSLP